MSTQSQHDFQGTNRFGILRRIGAGGMGVVYEAYDRERQSLVALKTLRQVSPETIYRFKQEFRSLALIVHPNLVPLYELVSDGDSWFFTMELLEDAVDLRTYLRSPPQRPGAEESPPPPERPRAGLREEVIEKLSDAETLDPSAEAQRLRSERGDRDDLAGTAPFATAQPELDLPRLTAVFTQLAEGVIALHETGILHRDLKPENVLVRAEGRVVLLDFGLVAKLGADAAPGQRKPGSGYPDPSDSSQDVTGRQIAGSVSYMAPEQAAAESLSRASDWYAVGVMLYELLTHRLPFTGRMVEVLRDKQLFDPPRPRDLVPGVPEELDALCMELLDRNPARRPTGLQVVARLSGEAGAETPGDTTVPAPVPAAPFVGRKRHLDVLSRCFEKLESGETGICRVHGRSGAGKSALIEHFLSGLEGDVERVVLAGRCYEQESVPFKAVDSLLDSLIQYLRSLSAAELEHLLPAQVTALARVFPALRRIQRISELTAERSEWHDLKQLREQAFLALRELLTRIGEQHPLLLCIDDLQWGDLDSAALLAEILRSATPPRLLMLFCYRTEHLGVSPCLEVLERLPEGTETRLFQETLQVEALTREETLELALSLIGEESPDARAQADWVVEESGGGALFIYELVQHLKAGLGRLDSGEVHLDEVLWQRVLRLPEAPRRLLEVIAVASRPIPLRHVQESAHFLKLPPELVGLLRSERLARTTGPRLEDEIECYHDRIRESIVAHLSPEVLKGYHAALVTSLEKDAEAKPELLAAHLEGAGQEDRAGRFYRIAAEQAAEALAFDRAEDFYRRALAFAPDDAAKAEILERLVHFYTDLARFADAYSAGREGASLFGVALPARFNPIPFVVDLIAARLRFGRRRVAQIVELPTMTDVRRVGAVRLMAAVAKAAYQVRPELCVAVNARMVNLCLKYGNTPDNAIGYMVFGAIFLGGILRQYRRGYEFGRLALELVEKYENTRQKAEVHFVVGYFGTSWLRPATEAEALWRTAYSSGLETGDHFHTGCACCATILSYLMRGVPMTDILEESERHLELLDRAGLREPAGAVLAVQQAIRNLQGRTRGRDSFTDSEFDEEAYLTGLRDYGSRHFAHYYHVVKMQAHYLWGDHDAALRMTQAAKHYLKESAGMLHSAEHHWIHALVLAALLSSQGETRRGSRLRALRVQHRKLSNWAALCPPNFLHKERLIAAELEQIAGDSSRADRLYEEARAAASEYGYLQIEALAHRLAARHARADARVTRGEHLRKAGELYRCWGATALADALESGDLAP